MTEGVAWGLYLPGRHAPSNFGQLSIETSGNSSDEDQMLAGAGDGDGRPACHEA